MWNWRKENTDVDRKAVCGIILTLLLTGMLTLAFNIQPVKASGAIYIRADGSIDPPTAPIQRYGDRYLLTNDIFSEGSGIYIYRDNMTLDGAGHTLLGTNTINCWGIYMSNRRNVTIGNLTIANFGNTIGGSRMGGGIYLYYGCSNIHITRNTIVNGCDGIELMGSLNTNLSENNITNNLEGVVLMPGSENVRVTGNTLVNNTLVGVYIHSSLNNTIAGNRVVQNSVLGSWAFLLNFSPNNTIIENDFLGCDFGFVIGSSNDSRIFHNNFINNTRFQTSLSENTWDNGYPSGGNYWSDYTGVDANGDGIGDTPYVIDTNNQDRYPLMNPWTPASPWPMFQHDPQHTGRSPHVGPSESPEATILLGNQTVKEVFGSPAIGSDGTLYLGRLYLGRENTFHAFNPDGTQKWVHEMPFPSGSGTPLADWTDPPALLESAGTVYVANTHKLYAIDMENGQQKWERTISSCIYKYLVVGDNGILYFTAMLQMPDSSYDTALIGLDQNGSEVLHYSVGNGTLVPSCPAIDKEGTIYVGYNNTLFAVNPDGTERWRRAFEAVLKYHPPSPPAVTTPSIGEDGTIYVLVEHESDWQTLQDQGYHDHLHAIDPETPLTDKWVQILHGYTSFPPTIDSEGNIYAFWGTYGVSAPNMHICIFDPEGNLLRSIHLGNCLADLLVIDAENTIYVIRRSVGGSANLYIRDSEGNETTVSLPNQEGGRKPHISLSSDRALYIGGHKNLYVVKSTVSPPPPPPPPSQPTQPRNIYPENGSVDVPIGVELVWSPPLENVSVDVIPWEWRDYVGLFTTIERQWQVTSVQGDYSNPVINEIRTAIIRRTSDVLNENWKEWIVLDNDMTYYWRVRYFDFRGIWSSWSEETSFTTEHCIPPDADFTCSNWNPLAGEIVTLDASGSKSGTYAIAHYYWDLNGDMDLDTETASPLIYYRWDQSGTYDLTLKVQSMGGDWDTVEKQVTAKPNSRWERTIKATNKRIFGANGPTEEDIKHFNLIKNALRLEQYADFYSSSTSTETLVRDMQIQMALKEKIASEEGEITCEQYILNILHDMELVDAYVNSPWTGKTEVNTFFSDMAKVNLWAELGLRLGGVALKGFLELALEYGHLSGPVIGVGNVLMIPTIMKAGVSLKLLYETLYDYWVWHFFNDPLEDTFDDLLRSYPYTKPEQIDHIFRLRDEYAEPLRTRREEFKEEVRAQLRAVLGYVLEKYKALPTMVYYVNSPVELRVYDELGNVTGIINGNSKEEIAGSTIIDDTVLIYPAIGSYRVLLVGTDEGIYGLDMTLIQEGDVLNFTAINIPICAEAMHLFKIDWATLSQGGEGVIVEVDLNGDGVFEYTFTSDSELTQSEFLAEAAPPLSVSISPLSASILQGQSATFTSTVSGGYTPYGYQWYLNGNPVSGAASNTWTFTPTTSGIYYVYLKVTDDTGNTTQSETTRITVTTVPVGGYSVPIQLPTTANPATIHIALLTILTAIFITIKRKTKRKH
jgi:parallel beta-helix repeat protein